MVAGAIVVAALAVLTELVFVVLSRVLTPGPRAPLRLRRRAAA